MSDAIFDPVDDDKARTPVPLKAVAPTDRPNLAKVKTTNVNGAVKSLLPSLIFYRR